MKALRDSSLAGVVAFLCAVFAASITPSVAADGNDDYDVPAPAPAYAEAPSSGATLSVPLGTNAILPAEYNGDVRDLPPEYAPRDYFHHWNEFEGPPNRKPLLSAPTSAPEAPPLLLGPMPAATQNFDGLAFNDVVTGGQAGAGWPPDVNGDVGPNHYIEAVNDAFAIYSKTGTRLAAFTENSLWSGAATGTPCDSHNNGDPVVLHDGLADRWILTDFAFAFDGSGNPVAPFYECIAVSKTGDPVSGCWWLYAVRMDPGTAGTPPNGTLNDYPKFGLWTDCLYMAANEFTMPAGSFAGVAFASFSRTALFSGAPLTGGNSALGFIANTTDPFTMIPANLLGTAPGSLPPAGTPEYFVSESQTVFAFEVRKFTPGSGCGAGGVLSAPTNVSQASYNGSGTRVPQPGTTVTLDTLFDRLMQKVQYRKIGSSESLWVVHDTQPSGSTNRPQWAQIDVTGGIVSTTPVQQQMYAPDTTLHRWMASLAVDSQGNMALGYSRGNATNNPSIYYAGRLASDPLNTLPQTEVALIDGSAAQSNNCGGNPCTRWGDYTAMSIDPADDCTFWYINEYYDTATNGANGRWHTRIGSFKFPSCTPVGAPTKLAFAQQPGNTAAGAVITPAVTVQVQDASGNLVTSSSASITIAIGNNPGGSTLGGTVTVNAVNGVATFNNLTLDKVGTGYTLTAASAGLTGATSNAFNITPGAATKLVFTAQPPASSQSGAAFGATVTVQDAAGNTVTGSSASISLTLSGGTPGATLSGTTTLNATNGVAVFSGLSVDKVGSGYQLNAASSGLTGAASSAFAITPGAATKLAFTAQPPASSQSGAAFGATVTVQDAFGNTVTGSSASISLTLTGGTPGATLSGTTTLNATNGVAVFSGLSVDKVGSGYQLNAASSGLTGAASSAFAITPGAATKLAFTTQPPASSQSGAAFGATVTVQDAAGNTVTGDGSTVTLTLSGGAVGATLSGTTSVAAVNGVATFSGLSVDKVGSGYRLNAADGALAGEASSTFAIVWGTPAAIVFTTQPAAGSDIAAGATIPLTAHVQDAFGNAVPGDSVTLAIGNNVGGSTLSVTLNPVTTDASGDATFDAVSLNHTGAGYTLVASDGTAPSATSHAFNIVPGAPVTLAFTTQPADVSQGSQLGTIAVTEYDANSNVVTSDNTSSVAFTLTACGGPVTLGTVSMASGVATLPASGIRFYTPASGLQVHAATGALSATSNGFRVIADADLAFSDGFDGCRP